MLTPLIVVTILMLFYLKNWKELKKDKKERNGVLFLTFIAIGISIMVAFDVPLYILMKVLNQSLGDLTKNVIKV
ncbi:hypothetical protein EKG37_19705 [Robertmurraya yapensis]|uniref:Uncharacterized protein n=1 Tax=Bacillus yapensis TaxID=2492960 RepID=A0A3S0I7Q5_9BACI|nr:hypothetical protein [Bacillus yapensis]RTR27113.1 hypothetical protein EKG37_19705 [Bacillus yapensis]TKS93960.1 hypothetical protein FAR12_19710 [Bacillus yapensis]